MTTLATRKEQIRKLEGFDIEIFNADGTIVAANAIGIGKIDKTITNRLKDSATVSKWIESRFEKWFPGYRCKVLNADRSVAHGNTLLSTVRETYSK